MRNCARMFLPVLTVLTLATWTTKTQADIIVTDNSDSGYTETSGWTLSHEKDDEYHAPDYNDDMAYTNDTSDTATWAFTGLSDGSYEIFAHWVPFTNRTTVADYTISDNAGIYRINQQLAEDADLVLQTAVYDDEGGFVENVDINFQKLCSVIITDGTLDVTLSFADETSGLYAIADAIAIKSIEVPEPSALALLMVTATSLVFTQRRRRSR